MVRLMLLRLPETLLTAVMLWLPALWKLPFLLRWHHHHHVFLLLVLRHALVSYACELFLPLEARVGPSAEVARQAVCRACRWCDPPEFEEAEALVIVCMLEEGYLVREEEARVDAVLLEDFYELYFF